MNEIYLSERALRAVHKTLDECHNVISRYIPDGELKNLILQQINLTHGVLDTAPRVEAEP